MKDRIFWSKKVLSVEILALYCTGNTKDIQTPDLGCWSTIERLKLETFSKRHGWEIKHEIA